VKFALALVAVTVAVAQPIELGSRRELFVDHHLIQSLKGAALKLQTPVERGVAFRFDRSHEGPFSAYVSIVTLPRGGFRAYYRGLPSAGKDGGPNEVTAYAESSDGISWTKPTQNIVLSGVGPVTHNLSVFVDSRSGVPAAERWKAIGGLGQSGIVRYVSEDGLVWTKFLDGAPMLPPVRAYRYDSQNVAFWSESESRYLCYFRSSKLLPDGSRVRWIARASSPDFRTWTEEGDMTFRSATGEAPPEHLYTNQTGLYSRAPHIYVSIAARFFPKRKVLSDDEARAIGVNPAYFNDISDNIFMTSRGGILYNRTFMEGFVRPGEGLENWTSRTNYPALNVIETGPAEMSFFVQRAYGQPGHHLARYTLRLDGFSSLHAGYDGGEMLSHPFRFSGRELEINYSTSAAGSLRFELQDESGKPLPGFALAESREIIGDRIARAVGWATGSDVSAIAGKTVRLRVVLKDADLFSIRFR
jgi:hypothetical protein